MSDETTTAVSGTIPGVVISAEDDAAVKAHLEQPAPAPPAEGPGPERVTTFLRLLCGHVFGTDSPCATQHYCPEHGALFPVASAHPAPAED